jgi:hypothetical protein
VAEIKAMTLKNRSEGTVEDLHHQFYPVVNHPLTLTTKNQKPLISLLLILEAALQY